MRGGGGGEGKGAGDAPHAAAAHKVLRVPHCPQLCRSVHMGGYRYDEASACGKPLGIATADAAGLVWTRAFAGCKVTLTCHNATLPDCTGAISYA